MQASIITTVNPFNPVKDRVINTINAPQSIEALAPVTTLPFVAVLNGNPVLANEYTTMVQDNDIVVFVTLPQGGDGGSNPLRVVLMIAVAVAAPHLAVGLMGASAGTVGALTTLGSLASAAIGFVGNALVNMAFAPSNKPSSLTAQDQAAASPTYNLTAQGNQARIGSAIPDCYGRHIHFVDFCADPYTEYAGNEQYLYQQFCLGQGYYEVEQINIHDTPIENFDGIEYEIIEPWQTGNLFPAFVETAGEVSGQELTNAGYLGGFSVSSPGQTVTAIAFDVVATRGLYYANDEGGLNQLSTSFKFEVQLVDDNNTPLGGWVVLGIRSMQAASGTPIRRSYRFNVADGRYLARAIRLDAKNTNSRAGHEIVWSALRGYSPPAAHYGEVTILNMRIRATNNISGQSSRQINVLKTRKLPTWNGSHWTALAPTRNPAWAIANILRAPYNGNIADNRIDLAGLLQRANTWDARNDKFDAIFDSQQVLFEQVNIAARAGRAKVYQQGGIWYCWRDEPKALPTAMFNMRNIRRGSVTRDFILPTSTNADVINVSYMDETTWSKNTVACAYPDSPRTSPIEIEFFGVVTREQAWREGMFMMAQNRFRRSPLNFRSEMEGFIPTLGDVLSIGHDRADWGQSGDVRGYDKSTQTIVGTIDFDFSAGGVHYIRFKKTDGSYAGPYLATAGNAVNQIVLDAPLDFRVFTGTDRERTSFSFGPGREHGHTVLVLGVKPRSLSEVELITVNDDPAVHLADTSEAPPVSDQWNLPAVIERPSIGELFVTLTGSSGAPLLSVSWPAAAGANYYLIELSYDGGNSWVSVATPVVSQAAFPVRRGIVNVRVAAMGLIRGDWVEYVGDPFLAPPPNVNTFLISRQSDGTRQFDWTMANAAPPDLSGYQIRYRLGSNVAWDWDDLQPMHDGNLTASPWETNLLNAGEYTFAIKAIDDGGALSETAAFVVANLGDQRLADVLLSVLPNTQNWPGTKTDCHVEDGALVANSGATWDSLTDWNSFNVWNFNPAQVISYEHDLIDIGGVLAFIPNVEVAADGVATITESHSDDGINFTAFAPLGELITARYIKILVVVTGADIPVIRLANIKITAESLTQEINDLNTAALLGVYRIGVGDIRLPVSQPFQLITQMQITLQNVGPGWNWELIDKNSTNGPRLKIYNAAGALADATIDALIRGA